jgi:uncharacterized protein YidB (DUF937 family)
MGGRKWAHGIGVWARRSYLRSSHDKGGQGVRDSRKSGGHGDVADPWLPGTDSK